VLATLLLVAVLLVGAAAVALRGGPPPSGPLQPSSTTTVAFPLAPAQTATWGSSLPPNTTGADMTLMSIDVINPRGLDVLGMAVSRPASGGAVVNAYGFPPEGVAVEPIDGARLPSGTGSAAAVDVLVGVQLAGAVQGTIDGLRITYETAGQTYTLELPYRLSVTPIR
jgi:hypothetical protein